MAPVGPPNGPDPPAEEMDDMFDYTVDMQDVFRDVDVNMDAPSESQAAQLKPKDGGDVLGLDEEVKVTRKRQPVAKLDEDRLDSFSRSLDRHTHTTLGCCLKPEFQSYSELLKNVSISKGKVTRFATFTFFIF